MYMKSFYTVLLAASWISASVIQPADVAYSEDQWKPRCDNETCVSDISESNGTNKCQNSSIPPLVLRRKTRQTRQPEKLLCILPEYPDNGTYTTHIPDAKPGDAFELVTVNVTCNPGFALIGSALPYCVNSSWSGPMPKCVSQCYLPQHPSVEYRCLDFKYKPVAGLRACEKYEINGTVVSPQCRSPNYYPAIVLTYMRCIDGEWDYIAASRCIPECGTISTGTGLLIGAETAKQADTPWHAGIYTKTTRPYKQICGGSLISNNIVLSAAHCFWNEHDSRILPAAEFTVAVGKFYRPWVAGKEQTKRSDVKALHTPSNFGGSGANFQDDIAVVVLKDSIEYSAFIRPVCLDFDYAFMKSQLIAGNMGKLAGWGLTAVNGTPSLTLKVIDLPYVNTETCIKDSPLTFRPYITSDKLCAGVTNGDKAVCKGDSGGGLAFPELERGAQRYYLRGIVSTAPKDENRCNSDVYTTFTMIQKHEHFIKQYWENGDTSWTNIHRHRPGDDAKKPNEDRCILPENPVNGTYTPNISTAKPGDALDTVIINITCQHGYLADAPSPVSCYKGWWTDQIPKCVLPCQLKPHPSVEYRCISFGDDENNRSCKEYEAEGTLVSSKCRAGYYSVAALSPMKCVAGSWDYVAKCSPECGTVADEGNVYELSARRAEVPWHAGIYFKTTAPYTLVNGGSLISKNVIITAAHYFVTGNGSLPASDLVVAAGTLHRAWDISIDKAQQSDVKAVHLQKSQADIAVLITVEPFKFSEYVRPVCVNFDKEFESRQLTMGKMGQMAGWDVQSENADDDSPYIQVLDIPFVAFSTCGSSVARNQKLHPHIEDEEICAGYPNAKKRSCKGYVGSGLVFPVLENVTRRYYLRGILSASNLLEDNCNVNSYSAYLRVLVYENFIRQFLESD